MKVESLTYESVRLRAVLVPLKRQVVSRVGFFDRWPLILIDLQTKEGIVGTSYLEPYLHSSPRYIMPAIGASGLPLRRWPTSSRAANRSTSSGTRASR